MFTKKSFRKIIFTIVILSALWGAQQGAAKYIDSAGLAITNSDMVVGPPFNISTGGINEKLPTVAYNPLDREFLVVWSNQRVGDNDIYAQRISERGELLSWFFVAVGEVPAVAYNPKNNTYLVVYHKDSGGDFDVYATRVDYTGPLGGEFHVAWNLHDDEAIPVVAYNTHPHYDEFFIVWQNNVSTPSTTYKIEGQRVAGTAGGGDGGGETIGGRIPVAVTSGKDFEPDVAYNLNMNEYLVVYTRGSTAYDVFGRRITGDGLPLKEEAIDSSGGNQYNPAVAAYRLNSTTPYLVVFTDTWNDTAGDVRGYLVNTDGTPNTLINIATTPGGEEYSPAIAHNEGWGSYLVTWIQGTTGDRDIFGMRVRDNGFTNPEFDIANYGPAPMVCERDAPDIAVGNVAALAVWSDNCGVAGGLDILGRMLGYRVYLPLVVQ